MNKISRRELARYAADQLIEGKGSSEIAKHLASILIEAGLADEVEYLLGDIAWELERRGKLASVKVTTATPLTQDLRKALKVQIEKATKVGDVLLEENVDKSVIGGIRVETSGRVWDETVARKLTDLREVF